MCGASGRKRGLPLAEKIQDLLQNVILDILDYDINTRREMDSRNRDFPFYVMSYVKRGEACLRVGGQVYRTGPGSIIIVPPHTLHDHYKETSGETEFLWWHFHFRIFGVVDAIRILRLPLVSRLSAQDRFEQLFRRYWEAMHGPKTLPNLLRSRAFGLDVMALILEELISGRSIETNLNIPEAFLGIFWEISEPGPEKISLNYLSEKYHMSPAYISNRFKKFFGIAPIEMRREIVFRQAKLLLRTGSRSVGDIARSLGFENVFDFTRAFTKKEGVSPTAYRRTHRTF